MRILEPCWWLKLQPWGVKYLYVSRNPDCPELLLATVPRLTRTRCCLDAADDGDYDGKEDILTKEDAGRRQTTVVVVHPDVCSSTHLTCKRRRHWSSSWLTSLWRRRAFDVSACRQAHATVDH